MSNRPATPIKNKAFHNMLKWGGIILAVLLLEGVAVFSSQWLTKHDNTENKKQLDKLYARLSEQSSQINTLEKISGLANTNALNIAKNSGNIELLNENLNELRAEVGNKKFDILNARMSILVHRMEVLEEQQNEEALILSLALIIKENALYHRSFSAEAEILADIAGQQKEISNDLQAIISLKNATILSDDQLIEQYTKMAENFNFSQQPTNEAAQKEEEKRSAVARSIDLIKDTVAGINFDKVVVLKKDKRTNEQKLLMTTLTGLVESHNFTDALSFIEENPQFKETATSEFKEWLKRVEQKLLFDSAISHIIAAELKALRENFKNTVRSNLDKESIVKDESSVDD